MLCRDTVKNCVRSKHPPTGPRPWWTSAADGHGGVSPGESFHFVLNRFPMTWCLRGIVPRWSPVTREDAMQPLGLGAGSRQAGTQAGWGHGHERPSTPCSGMGSALVCAHRGGWRVFSKQRGWDHRSPRPGWGWVWVLLMGQSC